MGVAKAGANGEGAGPCISGLLWFGVRLIREGGARPNNPEIKILSSIHKEEIQYFEVIKH